jgi:hypothetical protein
VLAVVARMYMVAALSSRRIWCSPVTVVAALVKMKRDAWSTASSSHLRG